jgi:putative iron-dependent peroxidase
MRGIGDLRAETPVCAMDLVGKGGGGEEPVGQTWRGRRRGDRSSLANARVRRPREKIVVMQHGSWDRVPIDAQSVEAPLSRSAVFLVMAAGADDAHLAGVRDVLGGVGDLVKNVGFRDLGGRLSCVVGIGSELWDRLSPGRRPADLRPFVPIQGPVHAAPSTPGDLLFHLRAEREDMTFELERQLLDLIGEAAEVVDETTGFRYFDARDLLGFVDGTANPTGAELPDAALIGADADPQFAGGSYVVVQKYLHDMAGWAALSTEEQEAIMGRTKIDNTEIDDDAAPRKSHKSLATIEDDAGGELDILRDNMPFGRPGAGEFGTYFIGYAGRLWVIEKMLERMFVGVPPGAYDRLLDFSTAMTGSTFFVPTAAMLDELAEPPTESAAATVDTGVQASPAATSSSLGIGSLRGQT